MRGSSIYLLTRLPSWPRDVFRQDQARANGKRIFNLSGTELSMLDWPGSRNKKDSTLEGRWLRLPFLPALTLAEACVPSQQKWPNIICRNREGQGGRG